MSSSVSSTAKEILINGKIDLVTSPLNPSNSTPATEQNLTTLIKPVEKTNKVYLLEKLVIISVSTFLIR
ncbi:hypothetical protein WICPIJ_006076 [Wickerhamomyces pijperi]|uniref:Uncharacterized protein n=1 Tax=Wickerhamomyces pijperi TaxID=599730 RepID=A0A9P8TLC9_WICPI|nr:hypothetical protein WICPIJ_006076 [Wickerhamomyces pijperi]